MDIMMKPILPGPNAQGKVSGPAGPEPDETSFARYMDKKATDRAENRLGIKQGDKKAAAGKMVRGNSSDKAAVDEDVSIKNAADVNALLAQLLRDLRDLAKGEENSGDWTFVVADQGIMQRLAAAAGMNEEEISQLLQKMEESDGKINLTEFLAELAAHFEELTAMKLASAPETDLAMLESFLNRLGLAMDTVKAIGERTVVGDGTFDLAKLLAELKPLDLPETITLTEFDAEQLTEMFKRAGGPDLTFADLAQTNAGEGMSLDLDKLKEILARGINEIDNNKVKPDLQVFMKDLATILAEAGFENKTVGWTPVVQEKVASVYEQLMASVDLSTVNVQKGKVESSKDTAVKMEAPVMTAEIEAEEEVEIMAEKDSGIDGKKGDSAQLVRDLASVKKEANPQGNQGQNTMMESAPPLSMGEKMAQAAETARVNNQQVVRQMPPSEMPVFEQISQGVVRSLEKGEHHMVLKLYPPELGEVKIDLMLRHEQVAVSFSMENGKVKEALEANMDQFRQNMEQKGFTLGECMVSVGGQDSAGDSWQRFEQAWEHQLGPNREITSPLVDEPIYNLRAAEQVRPGGISIRV